MSAESKTPASDEDRLVSVEGELNQLEAQLKREARISVTITVLALLLLSAYFIYGYNEFSKLLQPKEIVNLGSSLLDENIPVARQAIEDEIERSAPVWAENVSNQAVDSMPQLREKLEEYALEQSEKSIEKVVNVSRDRFRTALTKHHDEFQNLVTELSTRREATDEVIAALEDVLNDELGQDMEVSATHVLETAKLANDKLMRLSIGKDLSEDERKERHVMMIFRRLQMEEAPKAMFTTSAMPFSFLNPSSEDDEEPASGVAVEEDSSASYDAEESKASEDEKASETAAADDAEAKADIAAAKAQMEQAEAAAARAKAAEEAAKVATAEQQKAAKAAEAATNLAQLAARDAREATTEARKARDELRAAEKDARAAIAELQKLREELAKQADASADQAPDGSEPDDPGGESEGELTEGSESSGDGDSN